MLVEDVDRVREQSKSFSTKQQILQGVSQILRGPTQGYLFRTFGILGGVASTLGFIGVSIVANKLTANAERDKLTNTYRDELATILGKDRNAITGDDFKRVAENVGPDDPIRRDYEIFKASNHAIQFKSIVKNVVTSAVVVAFAALTGPFVATTMGLTIITGLSMLTSMLTENTLDKWQQRQPANSAAFVDKVRDDMSRGLITPVKLMEYSARIDPHCKELIRSTFGEDYATMSMREKQQAMSLLGQEPFLSAIARDLNDGRIRVSELPFLLIGKDSPSTKVVPYTMAVAPTAQQAAPQAATRGPSPQITTAQSHGQVAGAEISRVLH